MFIKLIAVNCRYIHSCPALFYVRNEMEANLPESRIECIQFTINDPYYEILTRISKSGPDAVGFSVYIWNVGLCLRLAHDLKLILPDTGIILGGPQAACLDRRQLPECTIIKGEIEGLDPNFYRHLETGRLEPEYRAARGKPFPMPYRPADFNHGLKNRHIYYESSRGCPFSCAYCLSSIERGVTYKDITTVKRELHAILENRPGVIRFVDRTFNSDPQRALEIWRLLADSSGPTVFHFEIAPEIFDEEMFRFLSGLSPGRFQFEIGVQSTNPSTLAAVNRPVHLARVRDNIKRLAAPGNIHLHVDLILGLPFETPDTFRRSFNDVFNLLPHYIQMGLLKVLPGTAIGRQPEYGLIHCAAPPYEILQNRWLDHEAIIHLRRFGRCVEAFYNNRFFKTVFHYLAKLGEDAAAFFERLTSVGEQHNFFNLAPTQSLMSEILLALAQERPDKDILRELLTYDWLRCGHRFLPEHLRNGDERSAPLKNELWQALPQNLPGFYNYQNRNVFFKKAVFAKFSARTLKETGFSSEDKYGYVAFLPEREEGVFKLQRTVLLPLYGCGGGP